MKEKVIELRNIGMSYKDIQKETGLSLGAISYHINNPDKRKSLKADIKSVREDYINGLPIKDICSKHDIGETTLWKYVTGLKRLDGSKRKKILQYKDSNLSNVEIANLCGCTPYYVSKTLKRKKRVTVMGKAHLKDDIIKMRKLGLSIEDVCEKLKLSKSTVLKYSSKMGFNARSINRKKSIELRKDGKDIEEISKKLGITKNTVYIYTKGIEKPKRIKMKNKKEVKASPLAIDQRAVLGQGVEAGVYTKEVKMRDNRDEGRLVSFLYSDLTDTPSVRISIRVRDNATDKEAVDRWCKKHGKKSWRIVK